MVFVVLRLLFAIASLIFFSQTVEAARRMRWSNGRDFTASSSLAQLCRNRQTYPRYDLTFIKGNNIFPNPKFLSPLQLKAVLTFAVIILLVLFTKWDPNQAKYFLFIILKDKLSRLVEKLLNNQCEVPVKQVRCIGRS